MQITKAIEQGCTAFPLTRKSARDTAPVLKPAANNRKFGRGGTFKRGPFKGMSLYSLTLEERATCPRYCSEWNVCYGNKTPFAHRFQADAYLESALRREIDALSRTHPNGFVVRLHVLGDFYSVGYVHMWGDLLYRFPQLHVFGYTHWRGKIKRLIDATARLYPSRWVIFQSNGDPRGKRPIALMEGQPGADTLPLCPEQAGKAKSCLDCGLCTNPNIRGVRWAMH